MTPADMLMMLCDRSKQDLERAGHFGLEYLVFLSQHLAYVRAMRELVQLELIDKAGLNAQVPTPS